MSSSDEVHAGRTVIASSDRAGWKSHGEPELMDFSEKRSVSSGAGIVICGWRSAGRCLIRGVLVIANGESSLPIYRLATITYSARCVLGR